MTPSIHNAPGSQTSDTQLTELVKQARDGKRLAFDQLIDRYQGDIHRMIYYRIRARMDAEDLTQDVFIRAYRSISRLREPERFRGWLYRIAVNRVNDYLRKKRVRSIFKSSDEGVDIQPDADQIREQPEALEQVLKEDFWRQVGRIAKKLSKMEREVFMLRFFDNLNINEIAQILKKSESTVKTHLYRALAKFKKEKGCPQCRSQKERLENELARLGQLAEHYAPEPHRRITVAEQKVRAPFFNRGFAFSAAAVAAVIIVVWATFLIRSQQQGSIGNLAQNMIEAERLMMEIDVLVENALPQVYLDIVGETNLNLDQDFLDFLIPTSDDPTRISALAKKGSKLC
jgi:RNA polymerase sigma-70 factor (ECF subfamily)